MVATLVGAAIATATALLTEIRKDRRDAEAGWLRARRDLYAAFLTALSQVRSGLLALSRTNEGMTAEDLDEKARQVFEPCYELRHQLELFARQGVVEPSVIYFRSVRKLRNLVAAGGDPDDAGDWDSCMDEVKRTLRAAREAMRKDLSLI